MASCPIQRIFDSGKLYSSSNILCIGLFTIHYLYSIVLVPLVWLFFILWCFCFCRASILMCWLTSFSPLVSPVLLAHTCQTLQLLLKLLLNSSCVVMTHSLYPTAMANLVSWNWNNCKPLKGRSFVFSDGFHCFVAICAKILFLSFAEDHFKSFIVSFFSFVDLDKEGQLDLLLQVCNYLFSFSFYCERIKIWDLLILPLICGKLAQCSKLKSVAMLKHSPNCNTGPG